MGLAIYSPTPVGRNGQILNEVPAPQQAETRYYRDSGAVSSVITCDPDTTVVEVTATGATALLRWVPASETAAVSPFASVLTTNFDYAIAAGQTRRFAIPIASQGVPSVVGYNAQNGLFNRYALINNGVGSVYASEFR